MSVKQTRQVVFVPASLRQFGKLKKYAQAMVEDGIDEHLIINDPAVETGIKFKLRRASPHADYELKLEPWRIFYRVEEYTRERAKTKITLIGEKKGNKLIVEGKEFQL